MDGGVTGVATLQCYIVYRSSEMAVFLANYADLAMVIGAVSR